MQRFNSFNLIHKALRAMLYDTALALQQTYFADVEEAEIVLIKIEKVIHNFEQHAHHEDTFILPAIETFTPGLVEEFEKEHVTDVAIGHRLATLLNIYRSLQMSEERINCGSCISKLFRDFMVFNINHMAKEEIEINKVLWENYSNQELLQLNDKISASIPDDHKKQMAKWMLRGINKAEAINWLQSLKKSSPSFVFDALFNMTYSELPKHMRTEVQEAVIEEEILF